MRPEVDNVERRRGGMMYRGGDYGDSTSAVCLELTLEDGDGGEEAQDTEEDDERAGRTEGHS